MESVVKACSLTAPEVWARTWGEVVNKTKAGKMLGISARQVNRLIEQGLLKTSFDGRVLVRAAAELYTRGEHERPRTRGYQPRQAPCSMRFAR